MGDQRAMTTMPMGDRPGAGLAGGTRRVLMFACLFPPCNCWPTASQRAYELARGLVTLGWAPVVITRSLPVGGCKCGAVGADAMESDRQEGLEVIRIPTKKRSDLPFPNVLGRSAGFVFGGYDNWVSQARRAARSRLVDGTFDLVWTTTAPISSLRLGRSFQRTLAVPWVAELRDSEWRRSFTTIRGRGVKAWILRRRASLLARDLRRADVVIHVAPAEAAADVHLTGKQPCVVPSGFEEGAWATLHASREAPVIDDQAFTVLLAGHVYPERPGYSTFFEGARLYASSSAGRDRQLRVAYLGSSFGALRAEAERNDMAHALDDGGVVTLDRSREAMRDADALLLIPSAAGYSSPGGKFYEYLAACRPILAVPGTDVFVADTLGRTGHGLCAGDAEAVRAALVQLASGSWVSPSWPSTDLEEFTWTARSRQLVDVFESCLAERGVN